MEEISKYSKIEQFRNVVKSIQHKYWFVGLNENEDVIYNKSIKLPKIKFKGTVKLHGTNAAIGFNHIDGYWFQSRNNIITPNNDNAGFARFANERKSVFGKIFQQIQSQHNVNLIEDSIIIYGE